MLELFALLDPTNKDQQNLAIVMFALVSWYAYTAIAWGARYKEEERMQREERKRVADYKKAAKKTK